MKKRYTEPMLQVMYVEPQRMVCASVLGVDGTGNLDTSVDDDATDEYLSRMLPDEFNM